MKQVAFLNVSWLKTFEADKLQAIQTHARAIAALLYEETAAEQLTTIEGIEAVVGGHILQPVSPEIGNFLSQLQVVPAVDEVGSSRASLEKSRLRKSKLKFLWSNPGPN